MSDPQTIKLLGEKTGSKLSDITPRNFFFPDISPWARVTTTKNEQLGLHQTKKILRSKRNHQQNEKAISSRLKFYVTKGLYLEKRDLI